MISSKHSFIFIHIPKTAGNSIHDTLRDYIDDEIIIKNENQDGVERFGIKNTRYPGLEKHSRLIEYCNFLGTQICNYKIYTILRNPFDKLISYYFWKLRSEDKEVIWNVSRFIELVEEMPTIEYFLRYDLNFACLNHKINYMKYENLNEDFESFCIETGLPKLNLSHRNKSYNRSDYRQYYDNDLIKLVKDKHQFELCLGDYKY